MSSLKRKRRGVPINCPDCAERLHCTTVEHPTEWSTVRYLKCEKGCYKTFKEISYLEGYGPILVNQVQKVAMLADIEKVETVMARLKEFVNPARI